jgi:hypothetical protein
MRKWRSCCRRYRTCSYRHRFSNQERTTQNPFESLTRLTPPLPLAPRPHVVKPDQINILASTMFRHLQQVQNAKESRFARQFRSNIRKPDWLNRIDLNLAFLHPVSRAYSDARTHPDPHTASDLAPPYPLSQPLSEHHKESLRPTQQPANPANRQPTSKCPLTNDYS